MRPEYSEMGFNSNRGTPSNTSLGFSPNMNPDIEGEPDATFVGKSSPLPNLAVNIKKNPHSVRGKKKIARNVSSGNILECAVKDPLQGLATKLTSIAANASNSVNHGFEAFPCDSFKVMASNEDGLGTNNGWEGGRNHSGAQCRDQSMDHVHDAVVHLEGEERLGFKAGGVGTPSGSFSRNGSEDEIGEEDRMVSEEGGEAKSSF
nr:hypothetical protein CFP56_68862 [Quercus suber]